MKLKNGKKNIIRKDFKYETKKYICGFQQQETIRSIGDSIYTYKASIVQTKEDQSNLFENIVEIMINLEQDQKKVSTKKRNL